MPRDFSGIGDAPKRREDQRFVTGQGRYLDDLTFAGITHAVVLRSPHAHAEICRIDTSAARAMPGVLAVLTAADAVADGLSSLLPYVDANTVTGERFAFARQPLLAADKVRYVGEPVTLIVAESKAQALDASEQVAIDYAPLPAVTNVAAARAPGAPQLAEEAPGNLCFEWLTGGEGIATASRKLAHVVNLELHNHRVVTNPMEPRGVIAEYEPATGRYTAHVSSQSIHATRDHAARSLEADWK
jgi:carbon-monoxide dehydrogenase large subunit